jgi:hypothetical protein
LLSQSSLALLKVAPLIDRRRDLSFPPTSGNEKRRNITALQNVAEIFTLNRRLRFGVRCCCAAFGFETFKVRDQLKTKRFSLTRAAFMLRG